MVDESQRYQRAKVLPTEFPRAINLHKLDLPLPQRYIAHFVVLFLAIAVVLAGRASAKDVALNETLATENSPFERLNVFSQSEYLLKPLEPSPSRVTMGIPVSTAREEVIVYEVVSGDTLYDIADKYGISVDSIIWSNKFDDVDSLAIGDKIVIPPVSGVLHTVQTGETLAGIAGKYKVQQTAITGYAANKLVEPFTLVSGQKVMVPGGESQETPRPAPVARTGERSVSSAPAPAKKSGSGFAWPTTGPIFTYFNGWHAGLDISPSYGTPVYASADGVVRETTKLGWSYGWYIILDNGGGFTTMYAHLSKFAVSSGQSVSRGQLIGYVGSTGKSTGPHLHFEIRVNGSPVDPLRYLP